MWRSTEYFQKMMDDPEFQKNLFSLTLGDCPTKSRNFTHELPHGERQMWHLVGFNGQCWWALMVSPCIARMAQAC